MPRVGTPLRAIVAANVRRLAMDRDIALNTLADLSGVSRSHLYAVLACERAASVDVLAKVADALGVDPIELVRADGLAPRSARRRRR